MSANDQLETVLRKRGQSVTAGRLLIFNILWHQKPMSMHQIIKKVNGRIDRASVYRTITLLEQLGIAQRVTIGWQQHIELSGPFSHHHHHLTCLDCQSVVIVDDPDVESLMSRIAHQHGYSLDQHQFEIQGLCPACSQRQTETPSLPEPA
jgi:Fur family ferric uptake transcriptional regulator